MWSPEFRARKRRTSKPKGTPLWESLGERTFVAIDFETADSAPDSACAIGLARVEAGAVVKRVAWLIRPPRSRIEYAHIHGITWAMVAKSRTFGELWPHIDAVLMGADFLVAHNASFDKRVLAACCLAAGLPPVALPFHCTVQVARSRWKTKGNGLAAVSGRLGIPLNHHHAGSDAEACARILLAAAQPDKV